MFFEYAKRMCSEAQVIHICISQAVTSIAIRYPSSTSDSLEPNLNGFFSSFAPRDRPGKSAVLRSDQRGKHRHCCSMKERASDTFRLSAAKHSGTIV